jgi:hypothetical protein
MLQNGQPRRNFKSFRPRQSLKRPAKASDGGVDRKLDYRAIVERHFGKHTGLQHSAKACLKDALAMETGRKLVGEGQTYQYGSVRNRASRPGETGRRQESRRFRQREARE